MTYRDIFLQADPCAVNDITAGLAGYRTQGSFDICKGLKLFAQGEIYDADEAIEIAKIRFSGKKFMFTMKQSQVIRMGIKAYLKAALKALCIDEFPNRDELVNQWLSRKIDDCTNINLLANNIIAELVYERFKS
ncbi:hypothetical protein [uncultured Duncaniella sp.]|uniref:hypothetical protein n=1 Tax=uncultured Duncaniella sp. TaxID=2768039 RepID=UPI0026761445|nr:hypothetical protein [uncultured Duncaniella sp.]